MSHERQLELELFPEPIDPCDIRVDEQDHLNPILRFQFTKLDRDWEAALAHFYYNKSGPDDMAQALLKPKPLAPSDVWSPEFRRHWLKKMEVFLSTLHHPTTL